MIQTLADDSAGFPDVLKKALVIAENFVTGKNSPPPGRFIPDLDPENLPEKGRGALQTLQFFETHYQDKLANSAGPNYFAFVTGGSTPAAVAGDWLVSAFDQNACGSNDSIAPVLERQTIHFLKQLFGLDDRFFGSFTTGATMSNFTGLAIARQWVGEQHGVDFTRDGLGSVPIKVLSGTPHASILKSLSMSGIGRNAWQQIPTMQGREAVDINALEASLKHAHHAVIVVANAGTVNTVDFDNLEAIGQLKNKYKFWLHVDAAFGGFAAASPRFAHLMQGINHADSVTVDAHKWLNVPYDAAMQFTKHKLLQLKVFQNNAAYLGDAEKGAEFFHYTPESSRRFRALPAWFTLMAYGKEGHAEIVERNCACAAKLGDMVSASADFRLLAPVKMNVVCFTLNQEAPSMEFIRGFLDAVRDDGRVYFTPTIYKGVCGIRAAISNWRTTESHMVNAFNALTEVWKTFKRSQLPL